MGSLGFWRRAQADPRWIAAVEPDGTPHAAGDVLARVNQLTHGLRARGLGPGDGVAVLAPNGIAPLEVYLAALQAGWYVTPINWHFTAPEIAYIVRDSEAKAFFVHERFGVAGARAADEAGVPAGGRISYGEVPGFRPVECVREGQPTGLPEHRTAGAAMHYTSGTTGRPKGVRRALSGLDPDVAAELLSALPQFFGITTGAPNVHLVTSPHYHTAVTVFGCGAAQMGHCLVYMDSWDSEQALALVERYRVTNTHMVPTQFKRMLALPDEVRQRYDLSSMRWLLHAAAPCPVGIKHAMLDWWGPRVYEYYAATEGGGTIATPEDWQARPGTVGKPWPVRRWEGVPARGGRHRVHADDAARFRVQRRPGQDRGEPVARVLHRRRRRLPRRGWLPVPVRPEVRHDHLWWGEHLPGRGRGRDHHAPDGGRCGGVRYPRRRLG
jgi:long-chain acyl-CoA synthetase